MQTLLHYKDSYFMDDPREGTRLERKVNASLFVDDFLRDHLDTLRNGNVLEAGCGSGALLKAAGNKYPYLYFTGIDMSDERVKQAHAKFSHLQNTQAIVASIYQLPFPDNHFDFIYSRFLFEYLQDPIVAAKELYRVCKPGAKILLQDLDGQFSMYPEALPALAGVLVALGKETGFDPNVGRKLFSFAKAAGFSFVHAQSGFYHQVFGKIDDFNYELWEVKLDIALAYLKRMMGAEKAIQLKADFLQFLKDENTALFSNLFTLTFVKAVKNK
jgi:ubiquinone/menaquinone biosynthesis C-methylase UbiE